MLLLHVDTGRQMRGGQWQALYLLESLWRRGWDVLLLSPAGSPLLRAAGERGLPVRPLRWAALARAGRNALLIHAHDAQAHTLAALLCPARPVLVSRRVAFPLQSGPLSRWKYRRASLYLAVSECVRGVLIAGGVDPVRIRVVYDGVPLLPRTTRTGGVVAPVSRDPRKADDLLREAERLGGFQVVRSPHLERDLRDAAVMVYLSRQEGLGSAALLAMAAGVPVIASRVGGLTEIVRDGETGLLVENTAQAVADAVRRLVADPDLAARLGETARQRVAERFTVEAMVEKTLEAYREVVGC